ncbi:MAG: ATP-dependent helicase [Chloroflexi bacterium]|nr:ATP-dependent helicase [Chloroflexota bacterium]
MASPISVRERLERLDLEQRAAATAPPGPILCIAPAGSGKTSTLVARIAWLVEGGADPETITALTFNRRAAEELTERLTAALPAATSTAGASGLPAGTSTACISGLTAGTSTAGTSTAGASTAATHATGAGDPARLAVRVRTFHALGLEILRLAGRPTAPLLDRETVLRSIIPRVSQEAVRRLDTVISRFKLDMAVDPVDVAADPEAGPTARAFVAYEQALTDAGGLDFDDLVVRAVRLLEAEPMTLAAWRVRCTHLLVDEAQDLDRMQLRLALLLAAPHNRIFLVGDDDQSIYGWRLADVRRLLGLAQTSLPGLRRMDLEMNYRCPEPVVERAVRLVAHNEERFAKTIRPRSPAPGLLILAPSRGEPVEICTQVLRSWPADDGSRAVLARTNRELLPAVAACLALETPFQARDLELPIESPYLDDLLAQATAAPVGVPLVVRFGQIRDAAIGPARDVVAALLHWSPGHRDLEAFTAAIDDTRARLARLRRDDAPLSLATVHGTKGLEFDHVAVIGLDAGLFPSARSIADAEDPARALEEERRLAYVAWTRARRSLTLAFDPEAPSQFILEAFDPEEITL